MKELSMQNFLQASDICNGIGFDNITVKYTFVDKILGSITMFVENQPDKNRTTENLILMNFAKSKLEILKMVEIHNFTMVTICGI